MKLKLFETDYVECRVRINFSFDVDSNLLSSYCYACLKIF